MLKSLFNKVAGLAGLQTPTQVFYCKYIAKFLRTAFFIEHVRWLLLQISYKKKLLRTFLQTSITKPCEFSRMSVIYKISYNRI